MERTIPAQKNSVSEALPQAWKSILLSKEYQEPISNKNRVQFASDVCASQDVHGIEAMY
jgi:hypothetical protein